MDRTAIYLAFVNVCSVYPPAGGAGRGCEVGIISLLYHGAVLTDALLGTNNTNIMLIRAPSGGVGDKANAPFDAARLKKNQNAPRPSEQPPVVCRQRQLFPVGTTFFLVMASSNSSNNSNNNNSFVRYGNAAGQGRERRTSVPGERSFLCIVFYISFFLCCSFEYASTKVTLVRVV